MERNNDTCYVDLNEIVQDYTPKTRLRQRQTEKLLDKFGILDEGDTIITGNLKDWVLMLSMVIDYYEMK